MTLDFAAPILRDAIRRAVADKVPVRAAALAFYSSVSLAPLLVVVVAVAGLLWGSGTAETEIAQRARDLVGQDAARTLTDMLSAARRPARGLLATGIALAVSLFAASRLFAQLRDALDSIWGRGGRSGVRGTLIDRGVALLLVLGAGAVFAVLLGVQSVASAAFGEARGLLPGAEAVWMILEFLVSLALGAGIFLLLYRIVPTPPIPLRDAAVGAVCAAFLFWVGKTAFSLYLGFGFARSIYGAAASLMVLLLWIYFSAQIVLFGFEITRATAKKAGRLPPSGS